MCIGDCKQIWKGAIHFRVASLHDLEQNQDSSKSNQTKDLKALCLQWMPLSYSNQETKNVFDAISNIASAI